MSLFDILRYGNVDLDSEVELDKLPEELLQYYRDEVWNTSTRPHNNFVYSTNEMAAWSTISSKPKHLTFDRALKKYSNDNI